MINRTERRLNNSLTNSSKEGTMILETKHREAPLPLQSNWEDSKFPLGLASCNKDRY